MCHSRNLVAFCENCFRHNLKNWKAYIFSKGVLFRKESTMIFRLLAKNCIFEILAKTVFWPFFNEDDRNIYGQRNCKNLLPTLSAWSKNLYQGNGFFFSFFWFISLFWKFMSRKPKNHYLAKIFGFFFFFEKKKEKNAKIFKSKKFIKKGRKLSVDTRI